MENRNMLNNGDEEFKIRLDNDTPSNITYLIDTREKVMFQHGGVCTRVSFDSVEQMDLDTFLTAVVPKLRKEQNKLTVIRNSVSGEYTFLLGDQVLRYHVTNVAECGLNRLCSELRDMADGVELITPNLLQPLIARYRYPGGIVLTVRVDSEKRVYNSVLPAFSVEYYPPPIWFRVSMNTAKDIIGMGVAVIKEMSPKWENAVLGAWPLANVYKSGSVCLGSSVLWGARNANAELTDGEVMHKAQHTFFTSNFNQDLTDSDMMQRVLGSSFDRLPDAEKLESEMEEQSYSSRARTLRKLLYVLQDPSGWHKLNYTNLSIPTAAFVKNKEA